MRIIYIANIIVAGWISISSLFYPRLAQSTVFSGDIAYSEAIRLVGALWGAIFLLSIAGVFYPTKFQLVLLFQLIYKSVWLLVVALPAQIEKQPYPKGMAVFFIIWVLILPFFIHWRELWA
ncbi:MAG: hypothetical protein J0L80_01005 [Chitinophagales bacterium]|nr:hypothetical protein [Chitinophagales bacterium]